MAWIKELFNKPVGSEAQINAAQSTKNALVTGEAMLTMAALVSLGLVDRELIIPVIHLYLAQLLLVSSFVFGYVEPRLDELKQKRKK